MTIRWRDQDIQPVMDALNGIRSQENGRVTFTSPIRFEELAQIVGSLMDAPLEVPSQQRNMAIRKAIFEVTRSGRLSKGEVLTSVRRTLSQYLATRPSYFWIRTSWSANIFYPRLKSLSVGAQRILFTDIPTKFSQDQILNIAKEYYGISVPRHYCPLLICVQARCEYSAIDKALDAADLARSLVNFILNVRYTNRTLAGPARPVNTILPGPLHTVHRSDGGLVKPSEFWYNSRQPFVECVPRSRSRDYSRIRSSTLRLRSMVQRSVCRDLVQKTLVAYVRALDHVDLHVSFLELWRALEGVTLSDSGSVTVRRASFLFQERALARQTLEYLRSTRNAYVHRAAESDDPEILLILLKKYVEALLLRTIGNPHRLRDAKEFADFLDSPNDFTEIERRLRILRCARKTLIHKPTHTGKRIR